MLKLDGSQGEGGGQILRTALALSLVTGQPFRMEQIRAGRKKPGLLHQHLAGVKAAAAIGGARVEGAELGSKRLSFHPGKITPGEYHFSVGTAGSAVLVLQTVLPALWAAEGPSTVTVEGGTHNKGAPPFEFLAKAFFPLVERMGPKLSARLERHGFFPAGGGKVTVDVEPVGAWRLLDLPSRGEPLAQKATAVISRLPRHIGERELAVVEAELAWPAAQLQVEEVRTSPGPGNVLMLEIESVHVTEVITAFGERGLRAEDVATAAAREAAEYLQTDAPVGIHLADQLLLPLALAQGGSFRTLPLSSHAITNMQVIERFLPLRFSRMEEPGGCCRVEVVTAANVDQPVGDSARGTSD